MQRLSGMDASFLYTETPTGHMHVTGVIIADTGAMDGEYEFDRIKQMLRSRLHLMPIFRRRVVEVPFSIDHPLWVEDPDFDLDRHVHRVRLTPPGGRAELAELVGDLASRPLDRSRPLWEMWVAEGAEDGTVALITKMHHAAIDGVTGADLMSQLFDFAPDSPDPEPAAEPWVPDEVPNDTRLFADSVVSWASDPFRAVRAAARTVSSIAAVAQTAIGHEGDGPAPALPFTAPRTSFTRSLTPHRSVAFGQADLDDFKAVKNAFDCKINDVVLATCSVALRSYLIDHDDLPDQPLVVMCPVSVHGEGGETEGTNLVSSMAVHLPVDVEDPVEQLELIREGTKAAKEMQNAMGADLLQDITQFAPPVLFNQAMRLYTESGLADRHRPVQNGVISNVPGPPIPLYVAGAEVVAVYPLGPLIEGAGINITVISNRGNMDFGIIACPELAPDIHTVAGAWEAAVAGFREAAERA
jgi:WS/DGAT/MGAT family acyltransferase